MAGKKKDTAAKVEIVDEVSETVSSVEVESKIKTEKNNCAGCGFENSKSIAHCAGCIHRSK